jgi:hypothetical protein
LSAAFRCALYPLAYYKSLAAPISFFFLPIGTVVRRAMLFGFFFLAVVASVMAAPSDTRLVQSIAANNTNINSTSIVQQNSDVAPSYAPSYAPSSTSVPVVATPSRMLLVETIDNSTKINGTDTTSVIQQLSGVAAHATSRTSVPVSGFIGAPLPTVAPTPSQVLIPQLDSSAVQQPNPATSSASSSAFGILLVDDGGGLSSGVRAAIIIGFGVLPHVSLSRRMTDLSAKSYS